MKFRIQRYDPDKDAKPYFQDYDVAMGPSDRMLLDALVRIKTVDDTLSPVSYTHLDVYKRQSWTCERARRAPRSRARPG